MRTEKIKNTFNKVLSYRFYALWLLFSVLLLACDPDEGIEPPKRSNNNPEHSNKDRQPCSANKKIANLADSGIDVKLRIKPNNEPEFSKQWYLENKNIANLDINIIPAWQKGYGTKPITLAIIDYNIDPTHPDLQNVTAVAGFPAYDSTIDHGTKSVGLIAAQYNNRGIIGVVPKAKVYSYSIQGPHADNLIINAFEHKNHMQTAVYSNSWGYSPNRVTLYYTNISVEKRNAMEKVTNHGFDGKGSNIVFAAGNNRFIARNDGYLQYYAVVNVNVIKQNGQVPDPPKTIFGGATTGVNLWITAPTGSYTTTNGGGYTKDFGRTSSAAPLVSGAIALLRSEFPNLSYRDVKLILAESATKYDLTNKAKYQKSGCLYSQPQAQQSYSEVMGFGLLNVSQALAVAQNWQLLPKMKVESYPYITKSSTATKEYAHEFQLNSRIDYIESLTLDIEYHKDTNLGGKIEITSPDGIKTELQMNYIEQTTTLLFNNFLGSTVSGTWKVAISHEPQNIEKVTLTFRGH